MKLKELLKSHEIVLATVAGLCLIAKVWVIRKHYQQEVEVNDLIFPLLMLAIFEVVHLLLEKKRKQKHVSKWWDHSLVWSIFIILSTVISTWLYVH